MATQMASINLVTADTLLKNWQGHRRLTRKTIEAFPEDKLFHFTLGGMRPFGEMAQELLSMAVPVVEGVATGKWAAFESSKPTTKTELLALWDLQTTQLNELFPTITAERFFQVERAFGEWEMPGIATIQYAIDNEIHHRGQAYVYLRALGIEPPHFWER